MEEHVPAEKTIGLPESIFMTLLVGAEEFIEFLILVFTLGVGIIVVEVMNGAVGALLEMYMVLRGGKGVVKLVVQPIGTFINGVSGSLLPGKTVAMLAGIWVINHPEMVDKATGAIGKFAGQTVQIATSAVTGGVTGAAAKVAKGLVVDKAAGPDTSAIRSRMAMVTGGSRMANIAGTGQMARAGMQKQQAVRQNAPEAIPLKKAA